MSWRAKHFYFSLSRRVVLTITARRFATSKINRSKKYKQFVIPFSIGTFKEFSFSLKRYKRPRRDYLASICLHRFKPIAAIPLVALGLIGVIIFGQQIISNHSIEPAKTFALPRQVVAKDTNTNPAVTPLTASVPINISIPAVNIQASVTPVGQAADGAIQMPPILDWTTGWYKYSPTPGQIGPAIIVGHVDNYKSIWVFWRLRYLQPGNDIYISRADGSVVHFKVTALEQFSQANFPTQEVYGNINYPGLRLITCGGTFSKVTESYDQNTVVYATMVNN
jgi:sortase (surface protein transpeptidase)